MIMLLLAFAQDAVTPTVEKDAVFTRKAKGTARLTCDSKWHPGLDLGLALASPFRFRPEALLPGKAVKPGDTWTVKDGALTSLVNDLHLPVWTPEDAKKDAYAKWRGTDPNDTKLEATGELKLTMKEGAIEAEGRVYVRDTGRMSSRYGPNSWVHTWAHGLWIKLALDAKGRVTGVEWRDEFQVEGLYTNGPEYRDPFALKGVMKSTEPKTATAEEEKAIRGHIKKLGSDDLEVREAATKALIDMGEVVVQTVRAELAKTEDAEVEARLGAVLTALGET